ncbi:NAD(P)-binding domain-containing protein [Micromonospora sp. C28SCA-DRY-2]|uniref:NAD(P)-dependent oxidoreductase n=1 Tax=Micromonospora sp. C28SCA-DRY-2 TaxID=3059522 RepID=UPI002675ED0A|nr:NAD(P)-binding domain-containing protein [Micromonospora sp. C28SCA-DRY-2]MDO3701444.1 NAD(P)-binding domain-containing protein [Micromonospora sp. C28SCA-DRY-2]
MTQRNDPGVSVLGLGAMGRALAAAVLGAGHPTTVWNRSPGRAGDLVAAGATEAGSAKEAVRAAGLVVVCLFDHASVHDVLDPVAADLPGRTIVNVTTTTPAQARELAAWAEGAGAAYVDGGIMAVPEMIGGPGSLILYSGARDAFDRHRHVLDHWGESRFQGTDAGLASLVDLALLAGMYVMFAGFLHGAAMVAPAGIPARRFAALAAPWLTAMTTAFDGYAEVVDGGDYTVPGQQSLTFSDLGDIIDASVAQGVDPACVAMVQRLIQRQVDAGHGTEGFARIYESLRIAGVAVH